MHHLNCFIGMKIIKGTDFTQLANVDWMNQYLLFLRGADSPNHKSPSLTIRRFQEAPESTARESIVAPMVLSWEALEVVKRGRRAGPVHITITVDPTAETTTPQILACPWMLQNRSLSTLKITANTKITAVFVFMATLWNVAPMNPRLSVRNSWHSVTLWSQPLNQ